MTAKTSPTIALYIATSLDGHIARPNGDIDWLSMVDGFDDDYGYHAFYGSVDALLMGSRTYTQVRGFGDWPYPGKKSYVLSSRKLPIDLPDVEALSADVNAMRNRIQEHSKVWLVGGAQLVASLHQSGLIDDYILSIIPIILGDGIPLFTPPLAQCQLKLVSSQRYRGGVVQLHYEKCANA